MVFRIIDDNGGYKNNIRLVVNIYYDRKSFHMEKVSYFIWQLQYISQ